MYVHLGREGLYYRQYLHNPALSPPQSSAAMPDSDGEVTLPTTSSDGSASQFIDQLSERVPAPRGVVAAFAAGIVLTIVLWIFWFSLQPVPASSLSVVHTRHTATMLKRRPTPRAHATPSRATPKRSKAMANRPLARASARNEWLVRALLLSGAGTILFGVLSLPRRRPTVVMYDLDETAEATLREVHSAFEEVGQCARVWVEFTTSTSDWKRHAGANALVTRQPATLLADDQTLVQANVPIPKLQAGQFEIWFLPDQGIVRFNNQLSGLEYAAVSVTATLTRFSESDPVPPDADVIGETWQYINRDGGPDRRFNYNRKLPVVRYGDVTFSAPNGWKLLLSMSRAQTAVDFAKAWALLQQLHPSVRSVRPPQPR